MFFVQSGSDVSKDAKSGSNVREDAKMFLSSPVVILVKKPICFCTVR